MEDPLYREIILEHWQNPHNYGEVKDATFTADGHNPLCGDVIHITGKIKDGKLTDIAFTAQGCAISKASASVLTDSIKGQPIAEVKKLTAEDVLENLGIKLTPARIKCALLVYTTLQRQI
jgi:nitrogen fixation NifU-like protein